MKSNTLAILLLLALIGIFSLGFVILLARPKFSDLSEKEQENYRVCLGKVAENCHGETVCMDRSLSTYGRLSTFESRNRFLKNIGCEVE